jgi:hypothetical protein
MIIFRLLLLYHRVRILWYMLDRRPGGSLSILDVVEKRKISACAES